MGGEAGFDAKSKHQQQKQQAATGIQQATRKAATSSRIRSSTNITENNPESVREEVWVPKVGRRLRLCSRLFLWIQAKFATISHGLSEVSFEGSWPSIAPPKFNETISKRGRKNKKCSGRVKKCEIMGNPAGERVRRRSKGEGPNLGRTNENFEYTPHRHTTTQHNTTPHNTTGDPAQGGWARGVL